MVSRSWRRVIGGLAVAVFLAAGCGGDDDDEGGGSSGGDGGDGGGGSSEPFLLGYAGDLTGPLAGFGVPMYDGFMTYVDHVNSEGGVDGRDVEVVVENYEADVNKARVGVETMVDQGVSGIFGGLSGNVWGPMAELAGRFEVPQMTTGVTDDQVIPAKPYVYSSQLGAAANAEIVSTFVDDEFGADGLKIGILGFSSAYGAAYITHLEEKADELGWEITSNQEVPLQATDATTQAEEIVGSDPDVVVLFLIDPITPLGVRALRDKGYTGPIVNYTGGEAEATFETLNDPDYYAVRSYMYPQDPSIPAAVEMVEQAEAADLGDSATVAYFTQGYVQAITAVEGLKACAEDCDGAAYNEALENLGEVDTGDLTGEMILSPDRHRAADGGRVYNWDADEGRAVPVTDWILTGFAG